MPPHCTFSYYRPQDRPGYVRPEASTPARPKNTRKSLPDALWRQVATHLNLPDAIHLDQALRRPDARLWSDTVLDAQHVRLFDPAAPKKGLEAQRHDVRCAISEHLALQTSTWPLESADKSAHHHYQIDPDGSFARAGFRFGERFLLEDDAPVIDLHLDAGQTPPFRAVCMRNVAECKMLPNDAGAIVVFASATTSRRWQCALVRVRSGRAKIAPLGDVVRQKSDASYVVSAQGRYVALLGTETQAPRLWRLTGEVPKILDIQWPARMLQSLAFSANEARMATLSGKGALNIFEIRQLARRPMVAQFSQSCTARTSVWCKEPQPATQLCWHADNQILWLCHAKKLWTALTPKGQVGVPLPLDGAKGGQPQPQLSASMLLGGGATLVQCVNGAVSVHSVQRDEHGFAVLNNKLLVQNAVPARSIANVSYDAHHGFLTVSTGLKQPSSIWNLKAIAAADSAALACKAPPHSLNAAWHWRQDGLGALCVDPDQETIHAYTFAKNGSRVQRLARSGGVSATWSLDGHFLLTGHSDGWVHLWADGPNHVQYLRPFAKHTAPVVSLSMHAHTLRVAGIDSARRPVAWAYDEKAAPAPFAPTQRGPRI